MLISRDYWSDASHPCTLATVATEVWFRNPDYYIKECLEVGVQNIVWDRGYLAKRSIDPSMLMDLYYSGQPYRSLVVEDDETTELRPGYSMDKPYAVYPSWSYGDSFSVLEELIEENTNDDTEHRVVVTNLPNCGSGVGRKFMRELRVLQEEYDDCLVHIHGLYSFRYTFGLGFGSCDIEPRNVAKKGKVIFPSGKELLFEKAAEQPHWITLLGFQPHELSVPRNRCMYNIKSAMWAGRHFLENVRFQHRGFADVDPDNPISRTRENQSTFVRRAKAKDTDKFLCDTCSLQTCCKYFRTGAICAVPDSEPQALATFFNTRDSDTIIQGLGTLLATQTRRAERGLVVEEENDKLDPEVTKVINGIFDRGVTLAKLVNPALAKPGIVINAGLVQGSNVSSLTSQIVQQLIARGIPLEQITPEMIQSVLESGTEPEQRAIDVATAHHAAS